MNPESETKLFEYAHLALQAYIDDRKFSPANVENFPDLLIPRAAFVTLYRSGELRGCIGHIVPDKPLYQVVCEMTIAAASSDPRFPVIQREELPEITVEISVLSPFEIITDFSTICIGEHGLIVQSGMARGLLLPQVAERYGWDAKQFLRETCRKAQLPPDAYESNDTQVAIFTAEILKEVKDKQ